MYAILLKLNQIIKQVDNQTFLKNIDLELVTDSQVGIKMTHKESAFLFGIISGKIQPSSGSVTPKDLSIVTSINEDQLYDTFSVQKYLKLFARLADNKADLREYAEIFSLLDVWNTKTSNLTIDQKRRVHLLRMYLSQAQLILIDSPLLDLTDSGIELYLRALQFVRSTAITVLITSNYMEELLLTSTEIYRYNGSAGLEKTDIDVETGSGRPEMRPKSVFKVACKFDDKTVFFSPNEIDYIESINGTSNIRVDDTYFPSTLTMNELEEKLKYFGFFRCHRSYLVNLQRISELISYSRNSYTLILKNSTDKLPLSRNRLDELRQLIE